MSRMVRTMQPGRVRRGHERFRSEATPFKLGTFEQNGRTFVGIVLKEPSSSISRRRAPR